MVLVIVVVVGVIVGDVHVIACHYWRCFCAVLLYVCLLYVFVSNVVLYVFGDVSGACYCCRRLYHQLQATQRC